MGWFVVALALPLLAAYLLIACCDREAPRGFATFLLRLSLAIGLGLGASSSAYFLWLFFIGVPDRTYRLFESAVFAAAVLFAIVYRRRATGSWIGRSTGKTGNRVPGGADISVCQEFQAFPDRQECLPHCAEKYVLDKQIFANTYLSMARWHRLLQISMMACLAFAISGVIGIYLNNPLGEWDAWGIWNLRARFIFQAGDQWRLAFSPIFSHTDYPLLVPCGNARLWSYLGVERQWTPWLLGCIFSFATVGALTAGVSRLRSRSQGLLAGMTLLGIVSFLRQGAWQYADVPAAYFMFSAVLSLALYDAAEHPRRGLLALSGVMAGMAAWTKNEGLLFLVALPMARGIAVWRPGRTKTFLIESACWGLGAAPILAIVAIQKVCFVGDNDIVGGQGWTATCSRILDPWRYWMIIQCLAAAALRMARPFAIALPLCFLLLGPAKGRFRGSAGLPTARTVLGLLLAGYFLVYVTTPTDLQWHLATSADRLLLHLWPMCLLCVFLYLASPEELMAGNMVGNIDNPRSAGDTVRHP